MIGTRYDVLLQQPASTQQVAMPMSRRRRKQTNDINPKMVSHVENMRPRTRRTTVSSASAAHNTHSTKDGRRGQPNIRRRRPSPMFLITTLQECKAAVKQLSQKKYIALDLEGVRLSRHGRVCLVQMASLDAVYLFDIVARGKNDWALARQMFYYGGLKELMENDQITKVMHDCRHDSDALYNQFGVKLENVLDTQVLFSVLRKVRGMEVGLPVSLKTLLKKFAGLTEEDLQVKSAVKESMRGEDDFWLKRPLSQQAKQYSRLDVEYLLPVSELLTRYVRSTDEKGWKEVLEGSAAYTSVYRDDADGPRKAQLQYEKLARVARRQRAAFEKKKRVEAHQSADPLRQFTFDQGRILKALET